MLSLLHSAVVGDAEKLRQEFLANQPFRHVVIEPFLNPESCAQLISEFPPFDQKHAVNEHGEAGRHAVHSDLAGLGKAYAQFDRLMSDRDFLALVGRITDIPDVLYDPEYVGGGTHENLDGEELDTHVDFNYHPRTHFHRRLNLIVFLNPEWEPPWGGCLELVRDPFESCSDSRKEFVPIANRAVIFETTEVSWHGFQRIRIPEGKGTSRKSIAVYFYSKERPTANTAASHATFYYSRPLPEHLRPGHTLSQDDVGELRNLLVRRDKQLQFLYQRELEFSESLENSAKAIAGLNETVASVLGSASFKLGRALTWPVRRLKSRPEK
jgi:2OG-Fe(II) oxygenase superfamily